MRYLSKGSESWRWHTYWEVHRFQKPPQPNPNYISEKWKLNWSKVHSVLFPSVLSILCSNTYWLSHLVMACGELFRVDIKQSGSWLVLWCICWTCVADFSSRYVIFIVPFFLTSISSTRQPTCSYAALCEISRCYLSFLPTSTLHHSFGCVVYLFRQLGWNWASQSQMSYPWSIKGNHDLVFNLCSFDCNFSTTNFKFWIGALLSNNVLSWLSYIHLSDRKCSRGFTQRPFRNWMSSLSALTSRTW